MVIKNSTLLRNGLFLELQFIISLISTKKQNALKRLSVEAQKRKTTGYLDRAIQRKIKADRRKSASSVKAEFGIIISEQTVRRKSVLPERKPYVDRTNRMKRIQKYREQPRGDSGIKCYGLMKVNLTCLALTEGLWFGEHRRKHSIPDTQFPSSNTEEEM